MPLASSEHEYNVSGCISINTMHNDIRTRYRLGYSEQPLPFTEYSYTLTCDPESIGQIRKFIDFYYDKGLTINKCK